jgi:hypothetical protein
MPTKKKNKKAQPVTEKVDGFMGYLDIEGEGDDIVFVERIRCNGLDTEFQVISEPKFPGPWERGIECVPQVGAPLPFRRGIALPKKRDLDH